MEILKIACIAVMGAIIYLYLKSNGSEIAGLSALATGIVLILMSISYVISAVGFFSEMASKTGISSNLFLLVIKITAISYLADFSSALCEDLGVKSLANKVNFASKIMIFTLSTPVILNLFDVISSLLL